MPDIFSRATNLKQVVEQAKSAELTAWWAFPPLLPVLHEQGIKADWAIEIGCGSGITSAVLRMMGMVQHCILLDISRSALLYTQQLFNLIGETAFFIQADACNSPVRTGSCDLAHSGGLIEHFVEDACATIVSEHCRVANCVGITVPANMPGYWVLRAYITLLNGLKWPFGFEQPLGRDQIFHLIEKNGCKIVSYRPRNVIQATMQRIASRFSNRTGTILYRVSDLRSPSFFDMELTVLAKKDVAYHEGV